ncbi:hypothetical protein DOY81_010735, partial [Sarcophaga bullata]
MKQTTSHYIVVEIYKKLKSAPKSLIEIVNKQENMFNLSKKTSKIFKKYV